MVFLTSKHILYVLGVDPTARDVGEGGGSNLVSQATPFAVTQKLATCIAYRYTS